LVIAIVLLFGGVLDHILSLFGVEVPVSEPTLERNIAIGFAVISTAAVVTGLVGTTRKGDRSILAFLAMAIGVFSLVVALLQASGTSFGW
jgi:hypothetical protein